MFRAIVFLARLPLFEDDQRVTFPVGLLGGSNVQNHWTWMSIETHRNRLGIEGLFGFPCRLQRGLQFDLQLLTNYLQHIGCRLAAGMIQITPDVFGEMNHFVFWAYQNAG